MKKFIEWTGTLVGKLVLLAIAVVLIICLIVAGYYAYLDTHGFAAKNYLIEKYDIDENEYYCTGYVQYIYSETADCDNTWFKECSDDPELAYKYTFTNKNKSTITVIEDQNGDFTDDFGSEGNHSIDIKGS